MGSAIPVRTAEPPLPTTMPLLSRSTAAAASSNIPNSRTGEPSELVHLEFIRNQAAIADGSGGEAVEAYHRSLFLYRHAGDMERWDQETRLHEHRLRGLELRLNEMDGQLASLPHLLANPLGPQPGETTERPPSTPWNAWDVVMFILAGIGVVGLLVFGILNISFNLLESGLITFQENPIRAYFWAALLPAGALAVKVGWDCLRHPRLRGFYLWSCLVLGILGVLAWLSAYASVYPSLSKNTAERIQSLSVFSTPPADAGWLLGTNSAGTRWIDILLVGSQAVAEIFVSAVLGIYMTQVFHRHHSSRSSRNPRFAQLDEHRARLEKEVSRERLGLAEARGQSKRLEHQLNALLAFAQSAWQQEVALRRDQTHQQRLLLDQIASQLREQLGGMPHGTRLPALRESLSPTNSTTDLPTR
jgi:hypothetical protein